MVAPSPLVISLEGELDIYAQGRFAAELVPAHEHPYVVLDFTDVEYVDSTCLSVLIRLRKQREERGFPPAHLAALQPNLRRVFAITRLDMVWPIFESVEAACAAFDATARAPGDCSDRRRASLSDTL